MERDGQTHTQTDRQTDTQTLTQTVVLSLVNSYQPIMDENRQTNVVTMRDGQEHRQTDSNRHRPLIVFCHC